MHLHNKIIEFFAGEMILSLVAAMIIQSIEIFNAKPWGFIAILAFFCFLCVLFFINCRKTMFDELICSETITAKNYFVLTGCPLAIMTILAFTLALFNTEPVYTYLFLPFKLFATIGVYKPVSALLSGVLFVIPILAVYLLRPNDEDFEEEE